MGYFLPEHFMVHDHLSLASTATDLKNNIGSTPTIPSKLAEVVRMLDELQDKLYASSTYSVLVIFQGLDAAGKDTTIKRVFTGVNPAGVHVHSVRPPNEHELKLDFLWGAHQMMPPKGIIGVLNRSYYEEVLITSVFIPNFWARQNIPEHLRQQDPEFWTQLATTASRNFEDHLAQK